MLIDSHCHLDLLPDYVTSLCDADAVGVKYILCPGVALADTERVLSIAQKYPNVFAAVGSHPTEEVDLLITAEQIKSLAIDQYVVGIGETGLDYYARDGEISVEQKEQQKQKFRVHIQVALELKKPLIIHSRDAAAETLQIMEEQGAPQVGGVFHCFTYDWSIAQQVLNLGFYLGISGIITFKNAHILQEVVAKAPLEKILLETDAPFLAPDPYRGKPNEPKYLIYIARQIAKLKGISEEVVAKQTTENFGRLFQKSQVAKTNF